MFDNHIKNILTICNHHCLWGQPFLPKSSILFLIPVISHILYALPASGTGCYTLLPCTLLFNHYSNWYSMNVLRFLLHC